MLSWLAGDQIAAPKHVLAESGIDVPRSEGDQVRTVPVVGVLHGASETIQRRAALPQQRGTTFSIPFALILALLGSRTTMRNPVV